MKQEYRVKEINPAYDGHFGRGKGWIYVSGPLLLWHATFFAYYKSLQTGFNYIVEYQETT